MTRYSRIICGSCYLYTRPLKSRYEQGNRYCENCKSQVERTREVGVVAFVYGDIPPHEGGRVFVFRNHDCKQAPFRTDVSYLLVDCRTADVYLLHSFITHVHQVNPPSGGARSITVLYRGDLGKLGANAVNLLFNNFNTVREFHGWEEVAGRGFA